MTDIHRKPKLLLVDDVPTNIKMLVEILASDHRIAIATDGPMALQATMVEKPDLILLDIEMPNMNGYEVCEKLKANESTRDIPVIFVTARNEEADETRGLDLGALDYITKPARPAIIKARVKNHLEIQRQRNLLKNEISAHKHARNRLQLASRVFENTTEGIVVTDHNNRIIDVNPAYTVLTGFQKQEALGRDPGFTKSGRHNRKFYANLWHQLNHSGGWQGEIWDRHKNGNVFPKMVTINLVRDEDGRTINHIAVFSDGSIAKSNEELLQRLAFQDGLTGLNNRMSFHSRLQQEIAIAKRRKKKLILLCIDLDKFKPINDTFGHAVGDKVLVEIAQRIQRYLRETDVAARMGGDEFSVILTDITQPNDCECLISKMLSTLHEPMLIDGNTIFVGASIGIAVGLDDGGDVETLMKNADSAMYLAKKSGRGKYSFFNPALFC